MSVTPGVEEDQAAVASEPGPEVRASLVHCADVAKQRAKNFYYGMKLTPEPKRSALYAVYAFMRACDDLADEPADLPGQGDANPEDPASGALSRLERFRQEMERVLDGVIAPPTIGPAGEVWPAFAHVMRQYPIEPAHLHGMLDGQRADLTQASYETFDDLYRYCYQVASTVGLVCLRVWGYAGGAATEKMAEHRGIALQLTNILRDVAEDAQRGRRYLPRQDFERFGVDPEDLTRGGPGRGFDALMRFQVERAYEYYRRSEGLEQRISRDSQATCWAMMRIYRGLLDRIATDPSRVLSQRVSLSKPRKLWIGLRAKAMAGSLVGDVGSSHGHAAGNGHQADIQDAEPLGPWIRVTRPGDAPRVVVVGGGVAGIAAGLRLADGGCRVTLLETRKRLGGRATSHPDPQSGELLDNCQHVLLGCCTHLMDLYRRLGVERHIAWHRRLYFATPPEDPAAVAEPDPARLVTGKLDVLEGDDLPAPLHLTSSLLGFSCLSWTEKVGIARAMLAMWRLGQPGREQLADTSFADWLAQHRQSSRAIRRFWANIIISACNDAPEQVSCRYAMQVFQEGFLAHPQAYAMGVSTVPLAGLYDAAEDWITSAGGEVRFGSGAERLVYDAEAGRVSGVQLRGGETLAADQVVSAVPFDRLQKLAEGPLLQADARLARLDDLAVSPIIGIHLWYQPSRRHEGPLMRLPHVVLLDSPLQWIFDKGEDAAMGGRHLHGVISAAHAWVDQPSEAIAAMADQEACRFLPGLSGAELANSRVIKEKRATFRVTPGVDRCRPGPDGGVENLLLAGDWCESGWPATMEGAARSGHFAADALLCRLGATDHPIPELRPSLPYRLIARG